MSTPHFDDFSNSLSELPRLDMRHFIYSYIKEQKVHAKSYAFEGQAFVSSWNRQPLEAQVPQNHTHATQALIECGFDTPVLKPRVTELGNASSIINKREASNGPIVQDRASNAPFQKEESKRKRASTVTTGGIPRSKIRQRVVRAKRHSNVGIMSSEQYIRLKERRERRQAKHVAINPVEPGVGSEPECEKTNKMKTEKGKKTRKKEKLKIPPALALMHGFSATNVRSGRLTINHSVGVFNKGKASTQNRVNNNKFSKAQGRPNISFTESAFLAGACSERTSRRKNILLPPSAFDLDSSTLDQNPSPFSKTEPFCPKSCDETSFGASDITLDRSSIVEEAIQPLRNIVACAESITWDIELDSASLPSQASSDLERGNIILNTQQFSWSNQKTRNCVSEDRDNCVDSGSRPLDRSISVRFTTRLFRASGQRTVSIFRIVQILCRQSESAALSCKISGRKRLTSTRDWLPRP
ncbi:hypothetical protein BDZ94DRAFT_709669 [Collybia nuda]|uniref:Uncharacterized protein n=1 Tax=Collybia nuda TaxID=64659 RepID=A0A9P5Y772_9AGAR|nr:hypothetical protein BDZ94DRAFT_709669 [Collybia nuda]